MIVFFSGSLTNCGLSGKRDNEEGEEAKAGDPPEEQSKPVEAPVRVVGEIASVHPAENFVLIKRNFQGGGFGRGILIASQSPSGQTASLALTGEKLGRYYAADIQEGTPTKGDIVVVRRLAKGSVAPSMPLPEATGDPNQAPWLKNFPPPSL